LQGCLRMPGRIVLAWSHSLANGRACLSSIHFRSNMPAGGNTNHLTAAQAVRGHSSTSPWGWLGANHPRAFGIGPVVQLTSIRRHCRAGRFVGVSVSLIQCCANRRCLYLRPLPVHGDALEAGRVVSGFDSVQRCFLSCRGWV
jgi:hypothetical protein